jgi:hypothetical protein
LQEHRQAHQLGAKPVSINKFNQCLTLGNLGVDVVVIASALGTQLAAGLVAATLKQLKGIAGATGGPESACQRVHGVGHAHVCSAALKDTATEARHQRCVAGGAFDDEVGGSHVTVDEGCGEAGCGNVDSTGIKKVLGGLDPEGVADATVLGVAGLLQQQLAERATVAKNGAGFSVKADDVSISATWGRQSSDETAGPLSGDLGTGATSPRPLERQSGGGKAGRGQRGTFIDAEVPVLDAFVVEDDGEGVGGAVDIACFFGQARQAQSDPRVLRVEVTGNQQVGAGRFAIAARFGEAGGQQFDMLFEARFAVDDGEQSGQSLGRAFKGASVDLEFDQGHEGVGALALTEGTTQQQAGGVVAFDDLGNGGQLDGEAVAGFEVGGGFDDAAAACTLQCGTASDEGAFQFTVLGQQPRQEHARFRDRRVGLDGSIGSLKRERDLTRCFGEAGSADGGSASDPGLVVGVGSSGQLQEATGPLHAGNVHGFGPRGQQSKVLLIVFEGAGDEVVPIGAAPWVGTQDLGRERDG